MAGYETAIVRLFSPVVGMPTAGVGLLVSANQVVTCAHVINTALGRGQFEQERPDQNDWVHVAFPLLPGKLVPPVRLAQVVIWEPPQGGAGGGDVAGLLLTEEAPSGAAPARFAATKPEPGTRLRVFGYPGSPPREAGVWVDVDFKGTVGGLMIQVESRGDQTVKAQPGYSGSPVWDQATGEAVGLLQTTAYADEPERDSYLLPPLAVAEAWEQEFDYLLVPENPYRGLEPFTAAHAGVFFGRNDDIEALAGRVRAQPVVVVVGPSGVGKSSLVQAGLIPALGESWSVALVRPGQDPWPRLAAGLLRAQQDADAPVTLAEFREEVDRIRAGGLGPPAEFLRSQDRHLLVVVDQFEEVLTGDGDPDQALLDLLLPPAGAAERAARVVLTLRADYQPALQSIPGFHTRLNDRLYLLSPLTGQQVSDAVQRPAAARGVDFEAGLADQIVADAAGGALSVLEFTLTRLWQAQRRKTLTFAGYHAMGGVRGALDRFAEQQAGQLGDTAAEFLNRVLLRLVRVPVDSPELATRQRAWKSQIPAAEWQVLQRLAAARLVVQDINHADGEPYAELAHETLITAWRRLGELVANNSEFLSWLAWARQRAADDDPLPEERIPQARHWADTRPGDIPPEVAAFIRNSETAVEARLRELREARDQAEAARERADAAARRAVQAAQEAEARRLAAAAELALTSRETPLQIPITLAVHSLKVTPVLEADIAVRHAIRTAARQIARLDHGGRLRVVAFSPDGTRVATGSNDGSARVFNAVTGDEIVRLGHDGLVSAVVFSPDGARVATGSSDGSARVFNAVTGDEIVRLDHEGLVSAVVFSPDGARVATGSSDRSGLSGSARVFDAAAGAEVSRLDHDGAVFAVAFSPDGARVAIGSGDRSGRRGSARVFDAATGAEVSRLDHDDGHVFMVAFSSDGARVATGSSDQFGRRSSARVFDAATGTEITRLDHRSRVSAVAFSPDGARVATGSSDGSARVFRAATGTEITRLDQEAQVNAVAFSPDGTLVATGSSDGSARVFDAATGAAASAEITRLDHDSAVVAVAFSPDGARVATGSSDGSARVFDAVAGAEITRLDHGGRLRAVAFSLDGARVATGSSDGSARVFDAATGSEITRLDHDGPVSAVAFSPDGTRVATGSSDGSARVFDAATGSEITRLDHDGPVSAAAFSPDGTQVATGSSDRSGRRGSAQVFNAATGAEITRLDHDGPVSAAAFSPDGTQVATGSSGRSGRRGSARVFNAATGDEITRLDHDSAVVTVAFSPDGTRVATGSSDGSARVFDAVTGAVAGAEITRLDHGGRLFAVAFSPDGTRVATGSGDRSGLRGSARVFDAATGTEESRLDHHDGRVLAVAFSPDGARVVTGSSDGSARVWCADYGQLIDQAVNRLTRNVTPQEWRHYFRDEPYQKMRADLP